MTVNQQRKTQKVHIRNKKNKVRKLLGFFLSFHLQQDWQAADTNPKILANAEWEYFFKTTRLCCKPTMKL